uniref:Uncharacterized protein n=1 Tax=Arundo donax TaxID=35708 RepID=A0A0A9ENX2_ARUDO
MCHLERKMKI